MSNHLYGHVFVCISGNSQGYKSITRNFSNYLKTYGYRDGTRHAYCSVLSHFLCWLTTESPPEQTINSGTVEAFLKQHLPVCSCSSPVFKEYKTARAALNNLLVVLGEDKLSPFTAQIPPFIAGTLLEFDNFQRDVCGLTESTRIYRQRFVRTFLVWLFGSSMVDSGKITPEVLVRFVVDQAGELKPSSISVLLSALRSYLRFLQFKGESHVSLLAAVPGPPNWSLTSIPLVLAMRRQISFWPPSTSLHQPVGVIMVWHVA
jgi:hypothetical protein